MKMKTLLFASTALYLCSVAASVADEDPVESTIRLMGAAEAELPEAVTKEIALPEAVVDNPKAVEKAAEGLEKANKSRQRRETGLSRADDARDRGAEMANEAQNNRENRGRSEDRPEPPENPGRPSD